MKWEANIGGMDCASCAAKIERVVRGFDEVEAVRVDVTLGRMEFEAADAFDPTRVHHAVEEIGYTVRPAGTAAPPSEGVRISLWRDRRLVAVVAGAIATVVGAFATHALGEGAIGIAAYVLGIALGGVYVYRHAWSSIRHRHLDINVLMTIAVVGAIIIGEWLEAATVVVLFAFAEWLEGVSMQRARRAIRELMELAPPVARVRRGDREIELPVEEVAVGDDIVVRPGEKIPLDGRVARGESEVDQSPITGESVPLAKAIGDDVYAGTLNTIGALEIAVTARASDSTLAHVARAIEQAQANRSESERFIERFARWYTPAVVVIALLIVAIPPLVFGAPFETWFYRGLVLLVIACPCALVIATPITTVSALARSAREGILVKGGRFLEQLGRLQVVVFDKTGTLTRGRPDVAGVHPAASLEADDVLQLAALAEERSEHYIARAIVGEARARGIVLPPHRFVRQEARVGAGMVAEIELCDERPLRRPRGFGIMTAPPLQAVARENHQVHDHEPTTIVVGTPELLRDHDVELGDEARARWAELEEAGATVVGVARDGQFVGLIECADVVREEAAETVRALRDAGVAELRVCTGDNERAAARLAATLGLPSQSVHARLMPADKVAIVESLRASSRGAVAMVGDGINDAPALATADVGIAMGAAGTDVALETAHVALMGDELRKLPLAIHLGRRTVTVIRQNVALALGIKFAVLALAAFGHATLWMAIAADMGTSLLVIGNGLRILNERNPRPA